MDENPPPRDPGLVFLKWLVIALTATMLAGMVVLISLFVTRFPTPAPGMPAEIALPDGVKANAFTRGRDWIAIVTDAGEILIYDLDGTTLRQRIRID